MRELQEITTDGFRIPDRGGRLVDLGLLSLRIALKSYFSTYQAMKYRLHMFDSKPGFEQDETDFNHQSPYFEMCAESLVHLQHFAELFIKEVLRKEHELLVSEASSKPLMLYKLVKGEWIETSELEGINTIGFSDACRSFFELLEEGKINNGMSFVSAHKQSLKQLNTLRNRVWHRGTFVLRYPALDRFVGGYILPFIVQVLAMPEYSRLVDVWRYRSLHCGIDPITEILKTFQGGTYDIGKVAFFKELGRAAYANPIRKGGFFKYFDGRTKARAVRIAEGEAKLGEVERVSVCPVCGVESLVVYNETGSNADDLDPEEVLEEPFRKWRYTWQVECACCSFKLQNDVGNASTYGLPIEDYWQETEIV